MAWVRLAGLLLLCGASLIAVPAAKADDVDLELVLAVDVSRSIDDEEFALQRQGYAEALRDPRVIAAIQANPNHRISVIFVEWSGADAQRIVVPWTDISDAESGALMAESILAAPRSFYGWTSISGAIDFSRQLFQTSGHEGSRRVIDISGDGINNSGRPADAARDEAVQAGLIINGLVIMNDRPNPGYFQPPQIALDEFYRNNVIGGPGSFLIAIQDFDTFAIAIINKLIKEIASTDPVTDLASREGSAADSIRR